MNVTLENCINRLNYFGYEVTSDVDIENLRFELKKILDYTVNYCNLASEQQLPDVLESRVIDRACAEFLFLKKNSGSMEGFDYSKCVKSLEEGDTKVTFAVGQEGSTSESRFDKMVDNLIKGYDKWICKYRVVRW